jgi:hypothetical protein
MHLNPSTNNKVGHLFQGNNHYCYTGMIFSADATSTEEKWRHDIFWWLRSQRRLLWRRFAHLDTQWTVTNDGHNPTTDNINKRERTLHVAIFRQTQNSQNPIETSFRSSRSFIFRILKPHCIRCSHFKVDDVSALKASAKPPVRIVEDNVTASLHQQRTPWPWLRHGCRDDVTWIC